MTRRARSAVGDTGTADSILAAVERTGATAGKTTREARASAHSFDGTAMSAPRVRRSASFMSETSAYPRSA